ncbi:PREDICTED: uncharacterized protein LOC104822840 isoform X1 [Tarenaya hassleriana]|uniref:uncharacterized protein LOC104822840 isoform X1 n=1 Tax=Tarenaya hassleriana TaxID=28532 RepID=UPI00053C3504|nr:PREDICTED: uncharacterized protein LOC104822840 isoform X1 [Tarenaya hassleriana]
MDNNGSQDIAVPVEGVAGGGTAYGWNDGGLSSEPLRQSLDPTEVPTAELVHVWCMPNTANVGPQETPRSLEPIDLLAARNERESFQIAIRPKVSWSGSTIAGTVQVQCNDLYSSSGDRLFVGQSLKLRRVVPVLGVPDALVPLELPVSQLSIFPGETSVIWVSIDVPNGQPPGQYEGEIIISAMKADGGSSTRLGKSEKHQLCLELKNCLDTVVPIEGKPMDEVVERIKCASSSLRRILFSPSFAEFVSDNGSIDMMEEDVVSNLAVRVKLRLTVWEFILPVTPSLPAVIGVSDTVIEDRFGVEHGSEEWYKKLDLHFKWLLQYRISPYFCRWGENMRVLTYTSPWPADHPKSDEYFSDPRLAAYAVPYRQVITGSDDSRESYLRKEVEILRRKPHWNKAYFYLWDEPLNMEHYDNVRKMASEIHAYAPDARVLTTYYCGPGDAPLAPTPFESFVKVPDLLRPHTQIYCTSEWVLGNREDLVKDIVGRLQPENGEEWWTYVCLGPSDPHPNWHLGMGGTQHRAVMWRVWKEGGTGFLYWGANCYEKATVPSAEIRFRRGLPPGDGVLFYPGEVFSSSSEPVASLRLERLLSGLQDFEYLKLYASKYGREEGLGLLEKTGVYMGPERYALEHRPIDLLRGEVYNSCRP